MYGAYERWLASFSIGLFLCSQWLACCVGPMVDGTSVTKRAVDVYDQLPSSNVSSSNGSPNPTSTIPQEVDVCGTNESYVPTHDITPTDADLILVALNLEYLESEFFLFGATGAGLDLFAPSLTGGGPPPFGAQQANLDPLIRDVIFQFGLQEVGHLRAIKETVIGAFPRVPLDLSTGVFARIMAEALSPFVIPFDAYANSLNYLLASYLIPYVGLTGYVGAIPGLQSPTAKRLVAGLLAVESGQDAVIRALLYERRNEEVVAGISAGLVTELVSGLRNRLGQTGIVDEGLLVPLCLGAEGRVTGNVLAGDTNSVGYARTPEQLLRIVYGTGDASVPGGFFPRGASGAIAQSYLARRA